MMPNQKKLYFFIVLAICLALIGCKSDDIKVWRAIPCKLGVIDCSSDESPSVVDIRMLHDDGSINDKVQFEQNIIEQNEKKIKYKKDIF